MCEYFALLSIDIQVRDSDASDEGAQIGRWESEEFVCEMVSNRCKDSEYKNRQPRSDIRRGKRSTAWIETERSVKGVREEVLKVVEPEPGKDQPGVEHDG